MSGHEGVAGRAVFVCTSLRDQDRKQAVWGCGSLWKVGHLGGLVPSLLSVSSGVRRGFQKVGHRLQRFVEISDVDPVDPGQGRCSITSVGVAEVLCASGSISARPLLDTEGCQFR